MLITSCACLVVLVDYHISSIAYSVCSQPWLHIAPSCVVLHISRVCVCCTIGERFTTPGLLRHVITHLTSKLRQKLIGFSVNQTNREFFLLFSSSFYQQDSLSILNFPAHTPRDVQHTPGEGRSLRPQTSNMYQYRVRICQLGSLNSVPYTFPNFVE